MFRWTKTSVDSAFHNDNGSLLSTPTSSTSQSDSSLVSDSADESLAVSQSDQQALARYQCLVEHLQSDNAELRLRVHSQQQRVAQLEAGEREHRDSVHRTTLQLQIKEDVVLELKRHLEQCLKLEPELRIQVHQLQSKLGGQALETKRVQRSLDWYKEELHKLQQVCRDQVQRLCERQGELQQVSVERDRQRIDIKRMREYCDMVEQQAMEEKQKMLRRIEEVSLRSDVASTSADSGVYAELVSDSDEVDALNTRLVTARDDLKHLETQFDLQVQYSERLNVANVKLQSEVDGLRKQRDLNAEMKRIQENTVANFKARIDELTLDSARKNEELLRVRATLLENERRLNDLLCENQSMNQLSTSMLHRFESMSALALSYRTALTEKEAVIIQLREEVDGTHQHCPLTIAQSSQTNSGLQQEPIHKSVQVQLAPIDEEASRDVRYFRNLLRVMDKEYSEKMRLRELNLRTMLKKVKEHMRVARNSERERVVLEREVERSLDKCDHLPGCSSTGSIAERVACLVADFLKLHADIPNSSQEALVREQLVVAHGELKDVREELRLLRQQLTANGSQCQLLEAKQSEQETRLGHQADDIARKEDHIHHQMTQINALELLVAETKAQLDAAQQKALRLEARANVALSRNTQLVEERATLLERLAQLEADQTTVLNKLINKGNSSRSRALEVLQKCSKRDDPALSPLEECVESLKLEMKSLHATINRNRLFHGEISLMEELAQVFNQTDSM